MALLIGVPAVALCDHGAGKLTKEKATEVSNHLAPVYRPAYANEPLVAGDGVRTLRRGFADIVFADKSEIRLNERSDLVIEDSDTMRRYALNEGAIWVRVAKGVRTVVRTPVGTATARGTVFTISADGTLTVLEGTVEYEVDGQVQTVHAGQTVKYSPKSQFVDQQTPYNITNPATGLTDDGWFDVPPSDFDLLTTVPVDDVSRNMLLYYPVMDNGGTITVGEGATGAGILGAVILLGQHGSPEVRPQFGTTPAPPPGLVTLILAGGAALRRKRKA